MSALQYVQAQQFTRLCSIILSFLPVRYGMSPSAKLAVFRKFISKSFIWDQKTFSHRNNFINSGVPQMPACATVYLKCNIDCMIPTNHYLFFSLGKCIPLGMPEAHLSLCLGASAIAFLGCAAVAVRKRGGKQPSQKRDECRELIWMPLGNLLMLEGWRRKPTARTGYFPTVLKEAQRAGTFS